MQIRPLLASAEYQFYTGMFFKTTTFDFCKTGNKVIADKRYGIHE